MGMIERTPTARHVTAALARPLARGFGGLAGLAFGLAALGACLHVPDGPAPMCSVSADCDQMHGEVCEEGVCWGNPPPGPFAAVVSPPGTSHDLVPRELPAVSIPDFGWMGDLALEAPLPLNGRILAFCATPMTGCDTTTTLGATVTVSRHSQFRGGPGFKTVINVDAGADSFAIPVPRTRPGDEPYTVTIVPAGGQVPGTGPAERVPPLRMQVSVTANIPASPIVLGGANLPVITGTLTDYHTLGLAGYRVVALGRWDPAEAPIEVSSVSFTDTSGKYSVILSDQLVGTVEIVARPPSNTIAPTIHIANIDATKASQRSVMEPNLGTAVKVVVGPVTGVDHSGMIIPVRGALVSVAGTQVNSNPLTSFAISDQQLTGDDGTVTLNLVDGAGIAGAYRMSIIPPASSSLGAMFDQKLVAATEQRLPARVALRGTIVDHAGKPLNNVAITARPSLRFLWTLDAAPQAFVAAIPAATAVTLATGEFVVWVDPDVAQVWGNYDLLIEPPATTQAPTYTRTDVDIRRDGTLGPDGAPDSVSLDKISLPDAAYVHGRITGPDGALVENAELRLYLVSTELSLCTEVANAPASCPIPAQLQDRNTSDATGTVRLTLPR